MGCSLESCTKEYQKECHTQTQKIAHYVGVPAFYLSLLIILGWVQITIPTLITLSFACLLTIGLIIYYFTIDIIHALVTGVMLIILYLIAGLFSQDAPNMFGFVSFIVLYVIGAGALAYCHCKGKDWKAEGCCKAKLGLIVHMPLCFVTDVMQTLGIKLGGSTQKSDESKKD